MIFKVLKSEQLKECSSTDRNKEARAVYASGKLIYCYAMACWRCSLARGQRTCSEDSPRVRIWKWELFVKRTGWNHWDVSFQGRIKHIFEDNLGRSQERKSTKPSVSCE